MGDKKASLWKRNLAAVAGATAAAAVTVAGCSSDADTSAQTTTPPPGSAESATPTTAEPSPPPPESAESTAAPAPAPAQPDGGGPEDTDMRDKATEQLKESLAADEAHWEGDTLIATMAWGTADSAGMDTVCRGADMLLEQWGTATLNFPDGTTRTCGE